MRGIRSGLPVGDCLRIIAARRTSGQERFPGDVEAQAVGISLSEAVARLYERMPVPEANFFATILIQPSQSSAPLSEALGNLSRVLRDPACKMAEECEGR